jgi:signal transduction histidine kinase
VLRLREEVIESFKFAGWHWQHFASPDAEDKNRFGLEGIRERARLLGGRARIRNEPGKGTRIAVELPLVLKQ